MSDLSAAAATLDLPEALVQRSAEARAQATGTSVEEVLTAWAEGAEIPAAAAAADAEPARTAATSPEQAEEPATEPVVVPQPAPVTETAPPSQPMVTQPAPTPSEVTLAEAAGLSEVITVPTAGIRERTNFTIPRWLVATMLIIPTFALFALGSSATGTCGEATELDVDVVTGEIVNCDGSEFVGSGVDGGGPDFIVLGEGIYGGTVVSGVNCAGCHGAGGGGGVGPALTGVLTTFGSCADHMELVQVGTPGFQALGRSTYGDTNKPVGGVGVMPPHASLSAEQLAAIATFERVRFGGADTDQALKDCGLITPEESDNGEGQGGGVEAQATTPGRLIN